MKRTACLFLLVVIISMTTACGGGQRSAAGTAHSEDVKKAEMIDVTSMTLTDALAELKAVGFVNVSTNVGSDEEWEENRWVVTSQSVEAGTEYALDGRIKLTCKKQCFLYLDLTSESNFILSRYDMDIYIGDEQVGTISNGETWTKLLSVVEDKYTLTACKAGDNSVKATQVISVRTDITFKSDIAHGAKNIEFKKIETIDGIAGANIEVPDVTGKVLREAMEELESAGFINVREEPYTDIWNEDNWIVTKQGVEAGREVDKNEYIRLDCIEVEKYFHNYFSGKTLADVEKMAEKAGFSLRYVNDKGTIKEPQDERKRYWIVTSAEMYSKESKIVKVYVKYEGTPEEKKQAEERKKAAEEKKKAEEKKAAEEKKKAEEERKAEEKKAAEEKKKEEEEKAEAADVEQESHSEAGDDTAPEESVQTASDEDIPYNKVESMNVETHFAHSQFYDDMVYLGNGEKASIYLTASPAGLTVDDFLIYYDDTVLSVEVDEVMSDKEEDQSRCTITAIPVNSGVSSVVICSTYEVMEKGEKANGIVVPIKVLDPEAGRIVYFTRSGEKYHFSADCAGPNAYATTLYEAESMEYGPCGNCVN